jgi:hypothetical protein
MPGAAVDLKLSADGLASIPPSLCPDEFTFILGKRQYCCSPITAAFLSPRVAQLLTDDPTLTEFTLALEDPDGHFADFLRLGSGAALRVNPGNFPFIRAICTELGQGELIRSVIDAMSGPLTCDNALDRVAMLMSVGHDCQAEIGFCAEHFCRLERSRLVNLPLEAFSAIVSNPGLQLGEEDWLYALIQERMELDERSAALFEFVQFPYLSAVPLKSFVKMISDSFALLTVPIWAALAPRLLPQSFPRRVNHRALRPSNCPCPYSVYSPVSSWNARYSSSRWNQR